MFLVEVIPALAYGVLSLQIPESPRYLVAKGEPERAQQVLGQVLITGVRERIEEIRRTVTMEARASFQDLRKPAADCSRSSGSASPS
jgi:SP family sugar:H+ symporter-like MFS transporter